jgi:hypothetical protein
LLLRFYFCFVYLTRILFILHFPSLISPLIAKNDNQNSFWSGPQQTGMNCTSVSFCTRAARSLQAVWTTCLVLTLLCAALSCATADTYDASVVQVVGKAAPQAGTLSAQAAACGEMGGTLFTDVSAPMHTKLTRYMRDEVGVVAYNGFLGGSSSRSTACPTKVLSLNCVWCWDAGRYATVGAELPFYRGNAPPQTLPGAGPLNAMSTFWYAVNSTPSYPSAHHQQYLVMMKKAGQSAGWRDDAINGGVAETVAPSLWYALCVLESITSPPLLGSDSGSNTLSSQSSPTAEDGHTPTTSAARGLSGGAWAGIGVVIAVVVVALVVGVVILLAKRCGWWCYGASVAAATAAVSPASPAQQLNSAESSESASLYSSRNSTPMSMPLTRTPDASRCAVMMKEAAATAHSEAEHINSADSLVNVLITFDQFATTPPTVLVETSALETSLNHSQRTVPHHMRPERARPNPLITPPLVTAVATPPTLDSADRMASFYTYGATPEPETQLARTSRMPSIPRQHRPLHRRKSSVSFVDVDD